MPEVTRASALTGAMVSCLLYALVADLAVETFLAGAAVRWWVGGACLAYALASAALRLRARARWDGVGPWGRAGASLFVLVALLAFTAWLPGGQVAGVKLAGLSTSRLFAAWTALAVVLSAFVLLRGLKSTPTWLRASVGALAAYALGALVVGIARHTAYPDLLVGASLWRRLPFWLQGAFLGVFLVVPLAFLAQAAALARRLIDKGAWVRELAVTLSLAAAVIMAVPALSARKPGRAAAIAGSASTFRFADERQLMQAAAERLVDEPPALADEVEPARLIERVEAEVRAFRPEDWDIGALATSLGSDPAAAFAFVRDAIGFDLYPGVLRGAEGTLAARSGNSWDRAVLLRELLGRAGLKTRLAFATLDTQMAERLVTRAYRPPVRSLPASATTGLLARAAPAMAARARRDEAALRLAFGARLGELGIDDRDQVRQEMVSHAWVQMQQGDRWVDLDPTLPDAQAGAALAVAGGSTEVVPPGQLHIVALKVVAESLAHGALSERVCLARELPAHTAARQHVLLAFMPRSEGGGLLRAQAKPGSYEPRLWVANQAQSGQPIVVSAASRGAGFDSFFGGDDSPSELTAVFIDVETRVPGRRPAIARHVVLDRLPRGLRARRAVKPADIRHRNPGDDPAYALGGVHHVMISTGGASALDIARRRRAAVVATEGAPGSAPRDETADWPSSPLWASDLAVVEGSELIAVQGLQATGGRTFVDQPRVFLGSWFPDPSAQGSLTRETDLLIDAVRVLPAEPTSVKERAVRQMQYGALMSGLETETALQLAAAWDPAHRTVISTSLSSRGPLTVVAPGDAGRLPTGSADALRAALVRGEFAVVSGEVGTATSWWTVAPSGFVRAIVEPGAGMSKIAGTVYKASRYAITPVGAAAQAGNNLGRGGGGGAGVAERQAVEKVATDAAKEGANFVADMAKDKFVQVAKPLVKLF